MVNKIHTNTCIHRKVCFYALIGSVKKTLTRYGYYLRPDTNSKAQHPNPGFLN